MPPILDPASRYLGQAVAHMTLHAQTLRLAARQFRAFNREALAAELAVPAHRHEGGWVRFRRTGSSNGPRAWEGRSSRDATNMRRSAPAFMPGVTRRRRYVGRAWDSMYWRRTESGAPPTDPGK